MKFQRLAGNIVWHVEPSRRNAPSLKLVLDSNQSFRHQISRVMLFGHCESLGMFLHIIFCNLNAMHHQTSIFIWSSTLPRIGVMSLMIAKTLEAWCFT